MSSTLPVTHYHPDHAGLAREMKQKGVVLVVNGKPAILYPEAALVNEAGRILTSKIGLDDKSQPQLPRQPGFLSRLGMEGEIIPTPGHSDGSISLILDESIAFTGDLAGRTWGADSMHQVENELAENMSLEFRDDLSGYGPMRKLE